MNLINDIWLIYSLVNDRKCRFFKSPLLLSLSLCINDATQTTDSSQNSRQIQHECPGQHLIVKYQSTSTPTCRNLFLSVYNRQQNSSFSTFVPIYLLLQTYFLIKSWTTALMEGKYQTLFVFTNIHQHIETHYPALNNSISRRMFQREQDPAL